MTTLIFEPCLVGHHLEYMHHLYMGAFHRTDAHFIFAVPRDGWAKYKDTLDWPICKNVEWVMLDDNEVEQATKGHQVSRSWKLSRMIKRIALAHNTNRILLIELAPTIPFLPLMLPSHIKVSGIIYKIYLRANATSSRIKHLVDYIRYNIMAHSKSIGNVYILNDPRSAKNLNKIYHTNNFVNLADPVPVIEKSNLTDLRTQLKIKRQDILYLHFGALNERKGTLDILHAIIGLSNEELSDRVFVFAGQVADSIREQFYRLADICSSLGAKIRVIDKFVSYSFLNDLCHTCDCILIPYKLTDLSSGAIGYAAVHHKPVIGPSSGLIGDLIRDNMFGTTLSSITPDSIRNVITEGISLNASDYDSYITRNSVKEFTNALLSN